MVNSWGLRGGPYQDVACSPDGRTFITLGSNGANSILKYWDMDGQEISSFQLPSVLLSCVAFSPDGRRIAAAWPDAIYVWEVGVATEPFAIMQIGNPQNIDDIVYSPDGKLLAAASSTRVMVWDLESRDLVLTHEDGHAPGVRRLAFDRTSEHLVIPAYNEVKLVHVKTGKVGFRAAAKDTVFTSIAAVSPDGRHLITPTRSGMIKIWAIDSGKEVRSFPGWCNDPTSLAFSPDGAQLAVATYGPTEVKLLQVESPLPGVPVLSSSKYHTLAYSPDGKWLAVPGGDNAVDIWGTKDLNCTFRIKLNRRDRTEQVLDDAA